MLICCSPTLIDVKIAWSLYSTLMLTFGGVISYVFLSLIQSLRIFGVIETELVEEELSISASSLGLK